MSIHLEGEQVIISKKRRNDDEEDAAIAPKRVPYEVDHNVMAVQANLDRVTNQLEETQRRLSDLTKKYDELQRLYDASLGQSASEELKHPSPTTSQQGNDIEKRRSRSVGSEDSLEHNEVLDAVIDGSILEEQYKEISALSQKLTDSEVLLKEKERKLVQAQVELEKWKAEAAQSSRDREEISSRLEGVSEALRTTDERARQAEEYAQITEEQLKEAEVELAELQGVSKEMKVDLNDSTHKYQRELERAEHALSQKRSLERDLSNLSNMIGKLERDAKDNAQQLRSANDALTDSLAEKQELQTKYERITSTTKEEMQRLENRLEQTNATHAAAIGDLQAVAEGYRTLLAEKGEELRKCKELFNSAQFQATTLQSLADEKEQEMFEMEEKEKEYLSTIDELRQLIHERKQELYEGTPPASSSSSRMPVEELGGIIRKEGEEITEFHKAQRDPADLSQDIIMMLKAETSDLNIQLGDCERKYLVAHEQLVEQEQVLQRLRTQISASESNMKNAIHEKEQELQHLQAMLSASSGATHAQQEKMASLDNTLSAKEHELQRLRAEISASSDTISQQQLMVDEMKKALAEQVKIANELDKFGCGLMEEILSVSACLKGSLDMENSATQVEIVTDATFDGLSIMSAPLGNRFLEIHHLVLGLKASSSLKDARIQEHCVTIERQQDQISEFRQSVDLGKAELLETIIAQSQALRSLQETLQLEEEGERSGTNIPDSVTEQQKIRDLQQVIRAVTHEGNALSCVIEENNSELIEKNELISSLHTRLRESESRVAELQSKKREHANAVASHYLTEQELESTRQQLEESQHRYENQLSRVKEMETQIQDYKQRINYGGPSTQQTNATSAPDDGYGSIMAMLQDLRERMSPQEQPTPPQTPEKGKQRAQTPSRARVPIPNRRTRADRRPKVVSAVNQEVQMSINNHPPHSSPNSSSRPEGLSSTQTQGLNCTPGSSSSANTRREPARPTNVGPIVDPMTVRFEAMDTQIIGLQNQLDNVSASIQSPIAHYAGRRGPARELPSPEKIAQNKTLRRLVYKFFGINDGQARDINGRPFPPEADVQEVEDTGQLRSPPSGDPYYLADWDNHWGPYNQYLANIFAENAEQEGTSLTYDCLITGFKRILRYLIKTRGSYMPLSDESDAAYQDRIDGQEAAAEKTARRHQRRRDRYIRRRNTAIELLDASEAKDDAERTRINRFLLKTVTKVTLEGQSSDESDADERGRFFKVHKQRWRASWIENVYRSLDLLAESRRPLHNPGPNVVPRRVVEQPPLSLRHEVINLSRTCYADMWYNELTPAEARRLRARDPIEVVPFQLS